MKKKSPALNSAFFAAIITLLAKISGAFYKIPLSDILGTEGSGLYQTVFPLYGFLITMCSGGIPTCVSTFVSKSDGENKSVSPNTVTFLAFIAFCVSAVPATFTALFSSRIAVLQGNDSIAVLYVILAPAIAFSSAAAVLKGYFQGKMQFSKSAISALTEQLAKIALGPTLAFFYSKNGTLAACCAALTGVTVAELLSFAYLCVEFFITVKSSDRTPADFDAIKKILFSSLSVTAGCLIMPLVSLFDSFTIINILSEQYDSQTATSLYGLLTGSVGSVLTLPTALYSCASSFVLPKLSAKRKTDRTKPFVSALFESAITLGMFFSISIAIYSKEILATLYRNLDSSMFEIGAFLLIIGAGTAFFSALTHACSTVAHSEEKSWIPTVSLLISAIARIILCPFLTRKLGINGTALASAVGYAITSVISLISIFAFVKPELSLSRMKTALPSLLLYSFTCMTAKIFLAPLGPTISAAVSATFGIITAIIPSLIISQLKKRKNA